MKNKINLTFDNKKICGIVAEYNPFHLGHKEQIRIIKEDIGGDLVIVIMSGHFLQRGIPGIMDKWTRAKMAVDGGADLVLELPLRFSLSSSDDFSDGALTLLSTIGVNTLCFGTEKESLCNLDEYAKIICSDSNYDLRIRDYLRDAYSYVKANELALSHLCGREVKIPANALLGLSYMKTIHKFNLNMDAVPIERKGAGFHELDLGLSSPSAEGIRKSLSNYLIDWKNLEKGLPEESYESIRKYPRYLFEEDFYKQIVSAIFFLGKDGLKKIRGVKEGLENRIYEAGLKTKNYEELLDFLTSKRYTSSTIRRILFSALLGVENSIDFANMPELKYHRVLAMNKSGRKYISWLRGREDFKPIVNFSRDIKRFKLREEDFKYDIRACGIYSTQCESIRANSDYLLKPYIKE